MKDIVFTEMGIRFSFRALQGARLLNLAACLLSVMMLLAFPLQSGFRLTDHFRTPEVRGSIVRHTFIAQHESGPSERIANQAVLPALLTPSNTGNIVEPVANVERSVQVPPSRLLLRLKLGPSCSGGQDPLL